MKTRIVDFPERFIEPPREIISRFDLNSRQANLGDIPPYYFDGQKFCKWCQSGDVITNPSRLYCSDQCKLSANMWCYPQGCSAKAYIMIEHQCCACALCGISYEDQILRYIDRIEERGPVTHHGKIFSDGKARLHGLGYHLSGSQQIDIDHVIPLHKGGMGLGLGNVQAVCRQCHKEKTYRDGRS